MDYRLDRGMIIIKYKGYYIIIICLMIGIFAGMVQDELVIPALGNRAEPYYHGIRGKNRIAMTFNVDWGEEYISGILKILDNKNIKVTFFVTGNWAGKFPDLLRKTSKEGHEIGNHGYSHKNPVKLSDSQLKNNITKNETLIYSITGKRTDLYAPPYGDINNRVTAIASSLGYKTIIWSADSIDWQRPAPEIIVQRVINKIDDGGIILLHPTKPTMQALPEIINKLEARNFKFVTISELIK